MSKKKNRKRDAEIDAAITVLNCWRNGNSSGQLRMDAFDLLRKWVSPKQFSKVLDNINGLIQACWDRSLADDYVLSVTEKVFAMLDYLCHCDDPELEYAGRYARKETFLAMGIVWDC